MTEDNGVTRLFDDSVYFIPDPRDTGKKIVATRNLVPGKSMYGESLVSVKLDDEKVEFRSWDPFRSKLSAGILNKLREFPFAESSRCLYLGASTGTTVSHISDIVGMPGRIFAVELAPRVARELLENVVKYRKNIIPIVADAKHPEKYGGVYGRIDVVYCDVAQPDQTQIAIENCKSFFEKGIEGSLLLIVKASSIDALKPKREVFEDQSRILRESNFDILQQIDLEPFDRNHALIVAKTTL